MFKIDKIARDFGMIEGRAAETSGGLFAIVPSDKVDQFLQEYRNLTGEVQSSDSRQAIIDKDVKILDV